MRHVLSHRSPLRLCQFWQGHRNAISRVPGDRGAGAPPGWASPGHGELDADPAPIREFGQTLQDPLRGPQAGPLRAVELTNRLAIEHRAGVNLARQCVRRRHASVQFHRVELVGVRLEKATPVGGQPNMRLTNRALRDAGCLAAMSIREKTSASVGASERYLPRWAAKAGTSSNSSERSRCSNLSRHRSATL